MNESFMLFWGFYTLDGLCFLWDMEFENGGLYLVYSRM